MLACASRSHRRYSAIIYATRRSTINQRENRTIKLRDHTHDTSFALCLAVRRSAANPRPATRIPRFLVAANKGSQAALGQSPSTLRDVALNDQ